MPLVAPQPIVDSHSTLASESIPSCCLSPQVLHANDLNRLIYGDPSDGIEELKESIRQHGVLVPLVVAPCQVGRWEILSGHRRWRCALALGLSEVPCQIRSFQSEITCRHLIVEYNRQRVKTFSQVMREADILEELVGKQGEWPNG